MTIRSLIASSLRLIGALEAGEAPTAQEAADALDVFRDMVDAWAAEDLTMYAQRRTVTPFVASQAQYTVGAGGDVNIDRPLWIDTLTVLDAAGTETPIALYTREQWPAVSLKAITTSLPEGAFYNPDFPLATLEFWPVPSDGAVSFVVYAPAVGLSASGLTLDTVIAQPPGWNQALKYNLAILLAPEFGQPVADAVLGIAQEGKARIKRANTVIETMDIDPALCARGGFDYRTGQ